MRAAASTQPLGRYASIMSATQITRTCLVVLVLLGCVTPTDSQRKRATQKSPCPDTHPWTGRYRNYVYGFSIVIPRGLKGYWNSARCAPDEKYGCVCMGDHGRFIPLSDDAHIEAYVGWQMESDWSLRDHERQEISFYTDDKKFERVNVVRTRWFRLRSLPARRFEARYFKDNKAMITDEIVALHKGVEYQLILVTSPDRYGADRRQFEKLVASWRLTPRVW
jgi:hypothetical protein